MSRHRSRLPQQIEAQNVRKGQLLKLEQRPDLCDWFRVEKLEKLSTTEVRIHFSWSWPSGFEAYRVSSFEIFKIDELVTVAAQ